MADFPTGDPTKYDRRFELLVRAVTDYAIYMLDTEGRVTSWNSGAERCKGYSEAEIIGESFARFYTDEDRARGKPARALGTARETGRFEDEGWRVRKDGTQFWAMVIIDAIRDAEGRLIGFAKITRDMTERRAAETALAERERQYRLLVMSVIDYAIFTLDRGGIVSSWNAGAERIKGYSAEQVIGQHFSIFYTEEGRAAGLPALALKTAETQGKFEAEGWRVRRDGSRFWANVVLEPIRDETGSLVGFAKVTRDISERRALEQAKEQLHQAQKMETLGQLTGGVAHDFNNLLTAVAGSLGLITERTTDARIQRLAEVAQRAVARGARLTSQLLAYGRRQTLRPQTANLNALVDVLEILLRRAVPETVAFETAFDPALWLTEVDQAQFQSALLNLVVNARDAMENGGGSLTIETHNIDVDATRAAALGEIAPGPYVVVAVRDTGVGMTAEVKARATEPFYTTKEVGKGSGLGLSQVYGFARQSNGQLEIDSEPGRGTTVRLYLPKSSHASAETAEDASRAEPGGSVTGTVLVVEDDADVLEITVEALQQLGYQVHSAGNAPEALTILQRNAPIDVLFTDVIMPRGMNGVELAREARRLRPSLRILLASGYARDILRSSGAIAEEMAFIAKPYQLPELAVTLKTMLRAG